MDSQSANRFLNMRKVFLIDYIGVHCGMHYYLDAFAKRIREIDGVVPCIVSNFAESGEKPALLNQYKGYTIKKVISLLRNMFRIRKLARGNKDDVMVFLTYGNAIEIPMLKSVAKHPCHIIDVHEAIAQDVDGNLRLKNTLKSLYSSEIGCIISHSERTDSFMREYGYQGKVLKVPHFRYEFAKNEVMSNIGDDIRGIFNPDKVNLLFFGNLNINKGVDILMEAFNQLPDEVAAKANLIIAGKDFDGVCRQHQIKDDREAHQIFRHVNDDELIHIYKNADVICQPYRKTSQSGILEMAFYFKKPVLTTDVPYFRKTLEEFSSFGEVVPGEITVENYAAGLVDFIRNFDRNRYFTVPDYDRYTHREAVSHFVTALAEYLHTR